ncbi:MAG: hypothetical protein Q9216_003672 [Gyalolechia sp. 2 TL-2023]
MAFQQPVLAPSRSTPVTLHVGEQVTDAPPPQQAHPSESQEWVLFPTAPRPSSSYLQATSTTYTPQTAGLSRLSEFGSFDTIARSDPRDADDGFLEEDEDLDSLDEGLHAFHEHQDSTYIDHNASILPTHDGLGTFPGLNPPIQEQLWRFEKNNPQRRPLSHHRRRSSVQRQLDALEYDDETRMGRERMDRIERWRIEHSRILLEEVEKESRRRSSNQMDLPTSSTPDACNRTITSTISALSSASAVTPSTAEQTDAEDREDGDNLWRRIIRSLLQDIMGLDEAVLSLMFGEALPVGAAHLSDDASTAGQEEPKRTLVLQSSPRLTLAVLNRLSRDLACTLQKVSYAPAVVGSPVNPVTLDYAGIPIAETYACSASAPSFIVSEKEELQAERSSTPWFKPTLQQAPRPPTSDFGHAALWGIEEEPTSAEAEKRDHEYWEQTPSIRTVFRLLQQHFTPRRRPLLTAGTFAPSKPSNVATTSTADSLRRASEHGIRIAIDRGGTFTDCVGNPGTGKMADDIIIKLLSEDPSNYDDAPLEGIRRLLSKFTGREIPRGEPLDTSKIESIRMGTTVATNALLERKGERIAMVVTKGFKDCLEIGNQSRPKIFDLAIRKPEVLYEKVVEVDERVTLEDYAEDPEHGTTATKPREETPGDADVVRGLSSEAVRILRRPEEEVVKKQLRDLYGDGFRSIAVCLVHGYTFPDHEALVGRLAREIGFEHISLSHELMPMIKLVPRATSACADAYLTPAIKKYIAGFQAGFEGGLGTESVKNEAGAKGARCEFMQSDGGLVDVGRFSGLRAILSGPAGGVVGYALTSYDPSTKTPVIGFDMGGTSTDVSRYGSGRYEHVFETTTAGVTIQSPQLDINTVAAGGGSRLFFRNGLFVVGPESAGAHPGPACYRKGGPLTVTDANLFLGRLLPEFFPKIFGEKEDQGPDIEASEQLFHELTDQINKEVANESHDKKMTVDEVAYGFIKIANETMTRPIRSLTEAKGHDTSQHRLATFGGAGGQHAVAIAESLGIKQILVHRYSSVLSAYGMALADVVDESQVPESKVWSDQGRVVEDLKKTMNDLKENSIAKLKDQGFADESIVFEEYLNMRYRGTESALMIVKPSEEDAKVDFDGDDWAFGKAFIKQHEQEFGFTLPDRDIIVDDVRARGIGKSYEGPDKTVDQQLKEIKPKDLGKEKRYSTSEVYFEGGRRETPIYKLENLGVGDQIKGPAILADGTQTIVVTPGSTALVLETHVVINIGEEQGQGTQVNAKEVDPIMLSIFAHRFMAIAEQMGRALQKTSVSTNVKERLDYSCALFDSEGGLVANAPHLPVHLGSMSTCVRTQEEIWRGKLKRGDVIVSNHPEFGGTHLPDITVVTPAFSGDKIIFYVASRAHHADIGGILPGSMPPHSRELFQEGAAIKSEKLVSEGKFDEERITHLLLDEPAQYPECSGTRCLADNLNDLKAQIAANQKGINLISTLIEDYGEEVVQFYMRNIQDNAELSVRNLLKDVNRRFGCQDLSATDHMDDGSPIKLKITIDAEKGEAVFDFTGTGPEVYGNINAPEAVTYSAIIYCLRCLISEDIPLNQGCLKPVDVRIPKKSFLSPSDQAAVVGGNVLTSQRVTDVILRCFQACAASQGDCNNLTFGFGGKSSNSEAVTQGFGYYETIAGGSGAGPTWDGTNGVHTHMTNTRITDAEVFERRYPVILREFGLRSGSAGKGQHIGGEGVIRDIEFRIPVQVSILSERRVYRPYGLAGGEDAGCGVNYWVRKVKKGGRGEDRDDLEDRMISMGGKNTASMVGGERIIVCTPGGGGWGKVGEESKAVRRKDEQASWRKGSLAQRAETQETI